MYVKKTQGKGWGGWCGIVNIGLYFPQEGEWAGPRGTARRGQPAIASEQAPVSQSSCKNQFNIDGPQWGPYQILS